MTANLSLPPTTIVLIVVVAFVILLLLLRCINILREYERGVVFRLGHAMKMERGPGSRLHLLADRQDREGLASRRDVGCAAAGHHHARQRVAQGECGRLLSRHRCEQIHHRGRELSVRRRAGSEDRTPLGAR